MSSNTIKAKRRAAIRSNNVKDVHQSSGRTNIMMGNSKKNVEKVLNRISK